MVFNNHTGCVDGEFANNRMISHEVLPQISTHEEKSAIRADLKKK